MLSVSLWAESHARIVRVSLVEGEVKIDRGDAPGLIDAFLNMPVVQGSRIATGPNGRAEIELEDGSTLRLTQNSSLRFDTLSLLENGHRVSEATLEDGEAYLHVNSHSKDELQLAIRRATVRTRKGSRARIWLDKNEAKVAVLGGEVDIDRGAGEIVEVRKQETISLDFSDPSRYYLARGISEEPNDPWNQDRDNEIAVLNERHNSHQSYSTYGYNAYDYGQLYEYGSFISVPTYGTVWQPVGFGSGWDPFYSGSWVWYPSYGYTWVSPYPWGWAPYHYGQWICLNGLGWVWQPPVRGHIVAFNPVPVVTSPPLGFSPLAPSAIGRNGVLTPQPGFSPLSPSANPYTRVAAVSQVVTPPQHHQSDVISIRRGDDPAIARARTREDLDISSTPAAGAASATTASTSGVPAANPNGSSTSTKTSSSFVASQAGANWTSTSRTAGIPQGDASSGSAMPAPSRPAGQHHGDVALTRPHSSGSSYGTPRGGYSAPSSPRFERSAPPAPHGGGESHHQPR